MTPEAQRIAIAEACGWQCVHGETFSDGNGGYTWDERGMPPKHNLRRVLPDYLNDLNAMHEAEKVIGESLRETDGEKIASWVGYELLVSDVMNEYDEALPPHRPWAPTLHATAAQRAEAFLKYIGKWEETA